MQSAVVVGGQVVIMTLLTLVGIFARKKGFMNDAAARTLSAFLLNITLPCVMVSSIYREKRDELLLGFALALFLGAIMHAVGILVSKALIKKREGYHPRAERFAVIYANSAYMAIPMIRAAMGEDATFYATAFVVMFLLFHWTHGVMELGGEFNSAKLLKNPCIISVFVGLVLFWFQIPLPGAVLDTVKLLAGLTTPLSMIIAGVFLSDIKISDLRGINMYWTAVVRNIITPVIIIAIVMVLGCANWFEGARYAVIASVYSYACPAAVSVILMSAALGKDAVYPSKIVAVTTFMSLITLPVMAAIADMLI